MGMIQRLKTTKEACEIINTDFNDNPVSTFWVRVKLRGRTFTTNGNTYYVPPLLIEGVHYEKRDGRYFLNSLGVGRLMEERKTEVNNLNAGTRKMGTYNKIELDHYKIL